MVYDTSYDDRGHVTREIDASGKIAADLRREQLGKVGNGDFSSIGFSQNAIAILSHRSV